MCNLLQNLRSSELTDQRPRPVYRATTNDNEVFAGFCLSCREIATLAPRFPAFRSSWKPQDIIDFYTYPCTLSGPPDVGACARVGTDVGGRGSASPRARVCLRRERRGWPCVIYSSVVARCERRMTSPSAFPFQSDSTPPTIKRKENFYMAQAPHRLVRVPPD